MFDNFIRECVYVEGGRDYPHLDCYGIVLEARKRLGLAELPEYASVRKNVDMTDTINSSYHLMTQGDAAIGSLALCWRAGVVQHVAVIIEVDGKLQALEINPKKNASICSLAVLERRFSKVEYFN